MITVELVQQGFKEGKSLRQIAREEDVSPAYLSKFCKDNDIKTPKVGRKAGFHHSAETIEKQRRAAEKRYNDG